MNPERGRIRVLLRKLELIGRVDLGLELDRLDRRPFQAQRFRAISALRADPLRLEAARSVSGLYCSAMMRDTAPTLRIEQDDAAF